MEKSIGKLNGCDIILRINHKHEYKCQRHIEFAEKLLTEWIKEAVPFVWYNWQESKVEPVEKKEIDLDLNQKRLKLFYDCIKETLEGLHCNDAEREKKEEIKQYTWAELFKKVEKECDENWRTMVYIKDAIEGILKRVQKLEEMK